MSLALVTAGSRRKVAVIAYHADPIARPHFTARNLQRFVRKLLRLRAPITKIASPTGVGKGVCVRTAKVKKGERKESVNSPKL